MMRAPRRILCGVIVLAATLRCGLTPPPAAAIPGPAAFFSDTAGDRVVQGGVALPAGFAAAVDRETTAQFVHVVADDVDQDGDLDVVASVGSLDLMVWQNDGAGHFTRLASSHRQAFQTQPPPPAVEGTSIASSEWIQNDDREAARLAPLRPIQDAAPRSLLIASIDPITPQSGPRARSSRAPPTASAL